MAKAYDLTGERYGKLVAVKLDKDRMEAQKALKGRPKTYWICKCDCGNEKSISYHNLAIGSTRSCGCIGRGRKKYDC